MFSETNHPFLYTQSQRIKLLIHDRINQCLFHLLIFPFATISELKSKIEKKTQIKPKNQRIFKENKELIKNNQTLSFYNIDNNTNLHLCEKVHNEAFGFIKPIASFENNLTKLIRDLIFDVKLGALQGLVPRLTDEGTSGTYFLQNIHRKNIAIFKPTDEEPFTPNNPKKYQGEFDSESFRKGILSGESAGREVAAYLLDSPEGYHSVPPTAFVEMCHTNFVNGRNMIKKGSLQMFVENDGVAEDFHHSLFSIEEVHKIAILDIRVLNCDRNDQNILIKKHRSNSKQKTYDFKLIPIDHGLSFPDSFNTCEYEIVWMDWQQVKEPFTKSEISLIEKIDPRKDLEKLSSVIYLREDCLKTFYMSQLLLKKAALKGLTLYDIGKILYKEEDDQQAEINNIVLKTERICSLLNPKIGADIRLDRLLRIWKLKNKQSELKKGLEKEPINEIDEELEEENEKTEEISSKFINFDDSNKENTITTPIKSPKLSKNDIHDEFEDNIILFKRSFSLPYLQKDNSDQNIELKHKKEKKKFNQSKTRIMKIKKKQTVENLFEEKFLYYFESFLDQLLEIKFQDNKKPKNLYRNRVLSSESQK